jgi:hypothetical protein
MAKVENWVPGDLKAPVKGLGARGTLDPLASEPVYHTKTHVPPSYVFIPDSATISAQWWRGTKLFSKVFFLLCLGGERESLSPCKNADRDSSTKWQSIESYVP